MLYHGPPTNMVLFGETAYVYYRSTEHTKPASRYAANQLSWEVGPKLPPKNISSTYRTG